MYSSNILPPKIIIAYFIQIVYNENSKGVINITILDIVIIMLFIVAFIAGLKSGVFKEIASLVGTVIMFVVAYCLKGAVGNFLCGIFPFFIKEMVTINIIFYQLIGFLLTFGVLAFFFNLILDITGWFDKVLAKIPLINILFKLAGAVVSMAKMYLTVFLILIILLIPFRNNSFFRNSMFAEPIIYKTPIISEASEKIVVIIEEIVNLDKEIYENKITENEANLKMLDLLLKYNMIEKDAVLKLYNSGKIRDIENIESVVLNY